MTIRSYRTRPAQVQATPFTTLTMYGVLDWIRTNGGKATEASARDAGPVLILQTTEGNKRVCLGDWIIRDQNGEFSRCESHEFITLYDAADNALPADQTAAALAEVRRLCELTIAGSVRVQAIDQARDTLSVIERVMSGQPAIRTDTLTAVFAEIQAERARQDARWGEQNHPDGTGPERQIVPGWTALDLANAARNACQQYADMGIVTWRDIFGEEVCEVLAESDPAKLHAELVQAVSVGVAWIQAIDRRLTGGGLEELLAIVAEQLPADDPDRAAEGLARMPLPLPPAGGPGPVADEAEHTPEPQS